MVNENNEAYVRNYIEQNLVKCGKVYIMGGNAVVSERFENSLSGYDVTRFGGDDRYETSALIAETFYGKSILAYLASGDDFPDGLTGGVLAGLSRDGKGAPLLLVNERNTNLAASYIKDAGVRTVKAIGGTAAIPDEVLKAVI